MNKEQIMNGIQEIDNVLAVMKDPPLTRADQNTIVQLFHEIRIRLQMSYDLEEQVKELEAEIKERDKEIPIEYQNVKENEEEPN